MAQQLHFNYFSGEIGLSELCVVKRENPGFFLSIKKMAAAVLSMRLTLTRSSGLKADDAT
jgi:hypothetical protein